MGSDIVCFVEVKIANRWHVYSSPRLARDYELFSIIGGERGEHEPLIQPRGLPSDASLVVQLASQRECRKPGYLLKDEIRAVCEWVSKREEREKKHWPGYWEHTQLGYITGNSIYGVPGSGYPPEFEDVRLVFWFN